MSLCSHKYYFIKMKMAVLRQPDLEALLVFAFDEQQQQNHFQSSSSYFTLKLSVIKYIRSAGPVWSWGFVLTPWVEGRQRSQPGVWRRCVTLQTMLVFFIIVGQKANVGWAGRVLPFSSATLAWACKQRIINYVMLFNLVSRRATRHRLPSQKSPSTVPVPVFFGLSGSVLDQFTSYLTGWTFRVAVNNMSETYYHVVYLKVQCWDPFCLAYVCSLLEGLWASMQMTSSFIFPLINLRYEALRAAEVFVRHQRQVGK